MRREEPCKCIWAVNCGHFTAEDFPLQVLKVVEAGEADEHIARELANPSAALPGVHRVHLRIDIDHHGPLDGAGYQYLEAIAAATPIETPQATGAAMEEARANAPVHKRDVKKRFAAMLDGATPHRAKANQVKENKK